MCALCIRTIYFLTAAHCSNGKLKLANCAHECTENGVNWHLDCFKFSNRLYTTYSILSFWVLLYMLVAAEYSAVVSFKCSNIYNNLWKERRMFHKINIISLLLICFGFWSFTQHCEAPRFYFYNCKFTIYMKDMVYRKAISFLFDQVCVIM